MVLIFQNFQKLINLLKIFNNCVISSKGVEIGKNVLLKIMLLLKIQ